MRTYEKKSYNVIVRHHLSDVMLSSRYIALNANKLSESYSYFKRFRFPETSYSYVRPRYASESIACRTMSDLVRIIFIVPSISPLTRDRCVWS